MAPSFRVGGKRLELCCRRADHHEFAHRRQDLDGANEADGAGEAHGCSVHPTRPLLASALHNGSVQLWNYQMGTLFDDRFDEHHGPVRGVPFHPSRPLLAIGGDDYKVQVWDLRTQGPRCLLTLHGHLDDMPWIVSSSDDQTIRIWNSTSRTSIAILTGHSHYENLIVSASMDQTVRVWDISSLRRSTPNTATGTFDTFSTVKWVLEGRDRDVNWASFHPILPLIVSASDDRQIRLWRMSETKACEVDSCRGHFNDRYSVLFHPKQELILSGAGASTRRFAAGTCRSARTFRRKSTTASSPHRSPGAQPVRRTTAASFVFKLERERPAFAVHQDILYHIRDKYVRQCDLNTSADVSVLSVRKQGSQWVQPRPLSYNSAERAAQTTERTSSGGNGRTTAIFVARNRIAVLNKTAQTIEIKDLMNTINKPIKPPVLDTESFYGGAGSLLIASLPELAITLANKTLTQSSTIRETIRINGVFIYSTLNHIKYALPNGDNGIMRTLDQPVYLTRVKGKTVHRLGRSARPRTITIESTEYWFKPRRRRVALHFVQDKNTRFDLVIECGNLDVAREMARTIGRKETWHRLAQQALKQGDHKIVEKAYQRTKNFDKLSFLHLATGQTDKLAKMQKKKIADTRGDPMFKFHNALYAGDVLSRIAVLRKNGPHPLAYLTAITNNLPEVAQEILDAAEVPTPVITAAHNLVWPEISTCENYFEKAVVNAADAALDEWANEEAAEEEEEEIDVNAGWHFDVKVPPDMVDANDASPSASRGAAESDPWLRNSPFAAEHVAAGAFERTAHQPVRHPALPWTSTALHTFTLRRTRPCRACNFKLHVQRNPDQDAPGQALPFTLKTIGAYAEAKEWRDETTIACPSLLGVIFVQAYRQLVETDMNNLALRSAIPVFQKASNHKTAARFAQRLIDVNPDPKVMQKGRKGHTVVAAG
ncbi:hypothetical protein EXIGLDRAFT_821657 [Exidia glandulosa HHB12029]|uniref:Uncharacterized protein n=1 Tax=Exidia glandulosa HHB12029 TaxID=1314781 RepID=A0A166NDU6_EXIGL|nr:hypothetical protein EXIGLDRAFT_821657 [Exidia glandulosa HHB12029]